VGVRFSIGDKIRNHGTKVFCFSTRERRFFLCYYRVVDCFFFFHSERSESGTCCGERCGVPVAFLWRSCGVAAGAAGAAGADTAGKLRTWSLLRPGAT
jgi:hypothetical protein